MENDQYKSWREQGVVILPREEFEELLTRIARKGAHEALCALGFSEATSHEEIQEIRDFVGFIRLARTTVVQTVMRVVTGAILVAILFGTYTWFKVGGKL